MNSLSWFIYLSDVVGNIQGLMGLFGAGCFFFGFGCMLAAGIEDWEPGFRYAIKSAITGALLCCLCALMPGKNTMYAIAASQVGEQVIASEDVRGMASDAKHALQQWIKKQIEPEKKS